MYSVTPTTTPTTYYERTSPSYYDRSPVYQTKTPYPVTPKLYEKYEKYKNKKKMDIEISNSGNSGMSMTTPNPRDQGYHHSPSPYDFYTPRPKKQSPSPTPYEFYSPSPSTSRPDVSRPKVDQSTPLEDHSLHHNKPSHRKPIGLRPHLPQSRPSPLQSLLNPFRNIFSFGGNRGPPHPPSNRRHFGHDPRGGRPEPTKETVPAPLPPPVGFPDFNEEEVYDEIEQIGNRYDNDRNRQRRKRPRRPLIDDSYKQEYQSDRATFQDLIKNRKQNYIDPGTGVYTSKGRTPLFRKRPSLEDRYFDMDYSPSDKQETMTTALSTTQSQTIPSSSTSAEPLTTKKYSQKQSNLEVGVFNPGSIESESGFVPVLPSTGNAPSLAFSIFDGSEYDYNDDNDKLMERSDTGYTILEDDITDTGDRGNVVVNIPAPVLPYVPRSISRSLNTAPSLVNRVVETKTDPWEEAIMRNTGHHIEAQSDLVYPSSSGGQNSADFNSFQTVDGADDGLKIRKVHDIHLSSKQLESDGPLLLSVGSSLSYGANKDPGVCNLRKSVLH